MKNKNHPIKIGLSYYNVFNFPNGSKIFLNNSFRTSKIYNTIGSQNSPNKLTQSKNFTKLPYTN